jgi:hypothetical protein
VGFTRDIFRAFANSTSWRIAKTPINDLDDEGMKVLKVTEGRTRFE